MTDTVLKTVSRIAWTGRSRNGNPTYRIWFTDGTSALTKTDSQAGYDIQNSDFLNREIEVTFDGRSRVRMINLAKETA